MTDLPEPDRLPCAPHPRETQNVLGHTGAQSEILNAINSGKLHHAWMITGPSGIGKATLAYQAAAAILAKPAHHTDSMFTPPPLDSLALPDNHPIPTRIRAGSEAGLYVLRRPIDLKTEKLKSVITVDEVRKLRNFFSMSAGGNGHRVVIVDSVDDLNIQAANALLKMLEEPPAGAVILLITHRPGAILPTIRSRCRVLTLNPLSDSDLKMAFDKAVPDETFASGLHALAMGSVGQAITLAVQGGLQTYADLIQTFTDIPHIDREKLLKMAEKVTARGNDGGMAQFSAMLNMMLSRLARHSLTPDPREVCAGEHAFFTMLNPAPQTARIWADLQQETSAAMQSGMAVNLDPVAMILDTSFKIEETATRTRR